MTSSEMEQLIGLLLLCKEKVLLPGEDNPDKVVHICMVNIDALSAKQITPSTYKALSSDVHSYLLHLRSGNFTEWAKKMDPSHYGDLQLAQAMRHEWLDRRLEYYKGQLYAKQEQRA